MSLSGHPATSSVSISHFPIALEIQQLFSETPRTCSLVRLSAQPRSITARENRFPRHRRHFNLIKTGHTSFFSELITSSSSSPPRQLRSSFTTDRWGSSSIRLDQLVRKTFCGCLSLPQNGISYKFSSREYHSESRRRSRLRSILPSSSSRQKQRTIALFRLLSHHSPNKEPEKSQSASFTRRRRSYKFSGS